MLMRPLRTPMTTPCGQPLHRADRAWFVAWAITGEAAAPGRDYLMALWAALDEPDASDDPATARNLHDARKPA